MSEEEIKALTAEFGLDPKKLTLCEPWRREDGRCYRFIYEAGKNKVLDYNFVLDNDDIVNGYEAKGVEFYVNKGLRQIAEKLNA